MNKNRFGSKLDLDKAAIISAKALFNEDGIDGVDLSNIDQIQDDGEIGKAHDFWRSGGNSVSEEDFKIILVQNGLDGGAFSEEDLAQEVLDALQARRHL